MKIDFDQELKNFEGITLKEWVEGETGSNGKRTEKPIILKEVSVNALLGQHLTGFNQMGQAIPEQIEGVEKMKRGELARKIWKGGEIELQSQEITLLKTLIGRMYNTLITVSATDILEQKEEAKNG